jgi:RNA polymerase sigma-70 factor, ECF subfamily
MKNLPELDDLALIRQIQHGDENAMEEFYLRFAPGLHAFLRNRVRNPRDIEDILAETMAAAVTAIIRFKGQSKVFTWLCRIAQFKLADHFRRFGNENELPLDEGAVAASYEDNDFESNFLVWQVLLCLNREYRRVLEDKYFNGYSTREIAFRLGRSEKAVDSILVRARQSFAREYKRLTPDDLEVQ